MYVCNFPRLFFSPGQAAVNLLNADFSFITDRKLGLQFRLREIKIHAHEIHNRIRTFSLQSLTDI